jgi:hypothetical protein
MKLTEFNTQTLTPLIDKLILLTYNAQGEKYELTGSIKLLNGESLVYDINNEGVLRLIKFTNIFKISPRRERHE